MRAPGHPPGRASYKATTTRASVFRGILVLLTLVLGLGVASFAPGQRSHREVSKTTLTAPSSLRERPRKEQLDQIIANSITNLDQSPKQASAAALPVQNVPSGIDCDNAPGIVIHDDGTVESGYQSGPGVLGIFVDKFTPASYPSSYTSVCLAFMRLCGVTTPESVEVVVFDDDGPGGSPGTELGALPVAVENIPLYPTVTPAWNSFDISSLNIVVNAGSVYIGARWTPPSFADRAFIDSDENGPGPGDGYYFDNISNVWTPIRNFFPQYRSLFVRAVEQPSGSAAAIHPAASSAVSTQRTVLVAEARVPVQPETPQGCPNQYVITQGSGTIVPGDTNIDNNCDECDTFVPLPFNFQLYGTTYTGVNVSSNGRLDFVNANEPGGYSTACLPAPPSYSTGLSYDNTIFPLWQDMRTDAGWDGCANFPGATCGVFTSVTGSAPNRIFNIEWRTVMYWDVTAPQNFEVRLYENDPNGRFDVVFGTLTQPIFSDRAWVSGVQGDRNQGFYTEDFCTCWPHSPPQNESRTYTLAPCATPTPTPTATPTATVTPTATQTPRPTPTPRGIPVPRVRPTPHPRP